MHLQIYSSMWCAFFRCFFVVIKSPDTYFPLGSSSLSMDDKAHVTIQFDALDPALRPERTFVPNEDVQQLQIPQQQQQHPSPPSSSSDHNHHQVVPLVAATSSGGSGGGHLSRSRSRHVRSRSLPQKNPVAMLLHNLSSKLHLKPTTAARLLLWWWSCDKSELSIPCDDEWAGHFLIHLPSPPPLNVFFPLSGGYFFPSPRPPLYSFLGPLVHTKEIRLRLLVLFSSSLPLVGFPARIMIFDETKWQLSWSLSIRKGKGEALFCACISLSEFIRGFLFTNSDFLFVLFLLLLLLRLV